MASRFAFTIYEMEKGLKPFEWPDVRYLICQVEAALGTGRHHIQGYVEFKTAKEFRQLKALHPTAWWGRAHGTREQNYRYCIKLPRVYPPVIIKDDE